MNVLLFLGFPSIKIRRRISRNFVSRDQFYPVITRRNYSLATSKIEKKKNGEWASRHLESGVDPGNEVVFDKPAPSLLKDNRWPLIIHKPTLAYLGIHKPTQTYIVMHKPSHAYTGLHRPT